jgi:hypothetical protein
MKRTARACESNLERRVKKGKTCVALLMVKVCTNDMQIVELMQQYLDQWDGVQAHVGKDGMIVLECEGGYDTWHEVLEHMMGMGMLKSYSGDHHGVTLEVQKDGGAVDVYTVGWMGTK